MSRTLKLVLAANLLVLRCSRSRIRTGWSRLAASCPDTGAWRRIGSRAMRLFAARRHEAGTGCHKPAQIGRMTTAGLPIAKAAHLVPFHQKLIGQNCLDCHSDHSGVMRFRPARPL